MPRIVRSRISALDSSMVRFIGAVVGVAGLISLGALFLGFSDKGMIDVNGKISGVDQSAFSTKVNVANPSDQPNGGLLPASGDSPAPSAPPPELVPAVESASTTATTSADSTEPSADEAPTEAQSSEDQAPSEAQ